MKRFKGRQKPKFDKEPVIIKLAPFGIFAFHNRNLVRKEIWAPEDFAKNYLEREIFLKNFKSKLAINAKYLVEGAFGEEAEILARKNNVKFDFQKFMIEFTKLKLKTGFSKDKLLKQASNFYDELNKIINRLYERLSEWYGLYWPEAVANVKSVDEFIAIVGKKREGQSMGYDIGEDELIPIKNAGDELIKTIEFKANIGKYLEAKMDEIAPNTGKIAGPILGAKLISIAGGLKHLAELPSSTIQLLGAEKALFRHIRSGAKTPKYGYLLSHGLMSKVKPGNRGKLARLLAGKIAITAKVDYYSQGKDIQWPALLKEIEEKVEKLK